MGSQGYRRVMVITAQEHASAAVNPQIRWRHPRQARMLWVLVLGLRAGCGYRQAGPWVAALPGGWRCPVWVTDGAHPSRDPPTTGTSGRWRWRRTDHLFPSVPWSAARCPIAAPNGLGIARVLCAWRRCGRPAFEFAPRCAAENRQDWCFGVACPNGRTVRQGCCTIYLKSEHQVSMGIGW